MTANAWPRVASTVRDDDFESLFLRHYDGVYRLLFRIVGTRQEAEDLAQETFLRLYRHRFAEGREHNLRAWLYRVATNLAYNARRGERRQEQRHEALSRQVMLPDDPIESATRDEERATVRRVLAGLPERQARLLLLRHVGLSYNELAEVLAVAPGSIGTLLARAEAAFQSAYERMVAGAEKGAHHDTR